MKKRVFVILAIAVISICTLLFNMFYGEAKATMIRKLNEEQMALARQAALGIKDFFAQWTEHLNVVAKMGGIIENDAPAQRYLRLLYEANRRQIALILRLDERGAIIYTYPASGLVGKNISDQIPVRQLLQDHKPVIGSVSRAAEGFETIDLQVPIFSGAAFKGSIGIRIKFESIVKRYLDLIKIGETGYAWVIDRDGTQLYRPIPGFTGKSVFENIKDYASMMAMVTEMLKGNTGTAMFAFDRIGDRKVGLTRKYAVYMPVHIENTFWSIAVTSADKDVLSGLIAFRKKLIFVIGAIFICGMGFATLGAKAWLIVKEEEKRRRAEAEVKTLNAELEQRVLERTAQLAAANVELDAFSHSVSHDLRAPLGHIKGFAELLRQDFREQLPEKARCYLDTIADSAKKMRTLIDDLLNFSRTSRVDLKKSTVNMGQLLDDVLSQFKPDFAGRQLDLAIAPLPEVYGDGSLLRQVWVNLLDNAMKYTRGKEKTTIEVGCEEEATEVVFYVKDNGVGFNMENAQKLFEVFQRLHSQAEFEGTGIGLANIRRIVARHGGRTWAQGEEGKGATFYFSIPISAGRT